MAAELVALVKHDCPVCDQVLPALDAAGARLLSQSSPEDTAAQAERLGLSRVPEIDADLLLSDRFDPASVPAVVLLEDGAERGRVEGLARDRMVALVAEAGATLDVAGLPEMRPGSRRGARGRRAGSSPASSRSASSRTRSRRCTSAA